MKKTLIYVIIATIVAGGIGFYGGIQTGKGNTISQNNSGRGGIPQGQSESFSMRQRPGGGQGNGGFTEGEILLKDEKSITVKTNDGGSKIVLFSATTKIMKSTEGLLGDLVTGARVMVQGTLNQDGSITGQMIQLRSDIATGTPR